MVEGESGILACSKPSFKPHYEPSKRRLTWPNGSIATTYSADEPNLLRGPQHHFAWADELASWNDPDAWDQLMFGLRLGSNPRAVITSTPRPIPMVRNLLKDPGTHVTRGKTTDNRANLAEAFFREIVKKYEGTRLGRQELDGEVLDDAPGALWSFSQMETIRTREVPPLVRIVIAVDPAVSVSEDADETGIIAAGVDEQGYGHVLEDVSGKYSPNEWALRAIRLAEHHEADAIVIETNQGGDMVENTLRTVAPNIRIIRVHAKRGKRLRAEPVAALYEQNKVRHRAGLQKLEDQMCTWEPSSNDSPDRMDAMVYALTELMLGEASPGYYLPEGYVA
jgi:predicted phage terminase large subunit-like protein